MRRLLWLSERLGAFGVACGVGASWLLLVAVVVICFDVVTRKFNLQIPVFDSTKLQELEWHLHGALFLLCLGYGYLQNTHVRIDVVASHLNPRRRAWLELFGCLVFAVPFCLVLISLGVKFWYQSFVQNEFSDAATGLPYRWILKAFIPIGLTILLVSTFSVLLRLIVFLFGPGEMREEAKPNIY